MKSYDVDKTEDKTDDIVKKHKADKDKALGKSSKSMEREFDDETLDDLDDIDDDENNDNGDNNNNDDDVLIDSAGFEAKIEKPMWKSKDKNKNKTTFTPDNIPSWHKAPSRMSTAGWLKTLVILLIPIVNIIFLLLWAFFSDTVEEEKKNFSKASIILVTAFLVLSLIFGIAIGGFNISLSDIKNKTTSITKDATGKLGNDVKKEIGDAVNENDNLTDDDFTK